MVLEEGGGIVVWVMCRVMMRVEWTFLTLHLHLPTVQPVQ
jgi:hypothetical protein